MKAELQDESKEDKVAKLRHLIEQNQREIEEAKKLLDASEKDVQQKRMRDLVRAQVIDNLAVDLFEEEKTKRPDHPAEQVQYITRNTPTDYLANSAQELMQGPKTEETYSRLQSIAYAAKQKLDDVAQGSYVPGNQQIVKELSVLSQIAETGSLYAGMKRKN